MKDERKRMREERRERKMKGREEAKNLINILHIKRKAMNIAILE